jgi:hypothetical protein
MIKMEMKATKTYAHVRSIQHKDIGVLLTVIAPSIMKSHLHAEIPRAPLNPFVIPAAINPEKAPEINEPE